MSYVRSSRLPVDKIKAKNFPDHFKKGDRNCFDCKYFVVKLGEYKQSSKGGKKTSKCYARCKKNLLLVEDLSGTTYNGFIREPTYAMYEQRLYLLRKGWRDKDWNFANRCEEFEDMRDKKEILAGKIIRAGKIMDSEPCKSTVAINPNTGELVKIK